MNLGGGGHRGKKHILASRSIWNLFTRKKKIKRTQFLLSVSRKVATNYSDTVHRHVHQSYE